MFIESGRGCCRVAVVLNENLIEKRSKAIFDFYDKDDLILWSFTDFQNQQQEEIEAYELIRNQLPHIEGKIIPKLYNVTENIFSINLKRELNEFEIDFIRERDFTFSNNTLMGKETILVFEKVEPYEQSKFFDKNEEDFFSFAYKVLYSFNKSAEEISETMQMFYDLGKILDLEEDIFCNDSNWGINSAGFPVILDLGICPIVEEEE